MFEKMNETEFKLGAVKFQVEKLSAFEGWNMIEVIRHEIGKSDLGDDVNEDMLKQFSKTLTSLDPAFVDYIRGQLFKNVTFKTADVKAGWLPLDGAEDMAFESLEPSAIYELLMRCLVVNFTKSITEILSRLKDAGLTSKSLKQPTSPPS